MVTSYDTDALRVMNIPEVMSIVDNIYCERY